MARISGMDKLRQTIIREYGQKIRALEMERDQILSFLSAIGPRLLTSEMSPTVQTDNPWLRFHSLRTRSSTKKTFRSRIGEAIQRMPGVFSSEELYHAVLEDGIGRFISKPTFTSLFSRMIAEGYVAVERRPMGKIHGLYRKNENFQTESPRNKRGEGGDDAPA